MPKPKARAARRRSGGFWRGNPARLKICPPNPSANAPSPNPSTPCCSNPRRRWTKPPIRPLSPNPSSKPLIAKPSGNLRMLTREGAEFVVAVPPEGQGEPEALGTQSIRAACQLDAPGRRNRQTAGRTARSRAALARRRPQLGTSGACFDRERTSAFSSAGRRSRGRTSCWKKAKNSLHHGILKKRFFSSPRGRPATAGRQHHRGPRRPALSPPPSRPRIRKELLHDIGQRRAGLVPRGARGADAAGRSQHPFRQPAHHRPRTARRRRSFSCSRKPRSRHTPTRTRL